MRKPLILAGCVGVIVVAVLALCLRRPGEALTIGFVGYTNYAGVRAALFAVTNHSTCEISFSGYAQRRTPTGWENVYPGEGPLGAGDPLYGLFELPAGQTLTFMTTLLPGSWHGSVYYRCPATRLDQVRQRLSCSLQTAGLPDGITRLIYHQRAAVIHSRELQN
jgi:hypothetical protein